jgi:hypothetical protein
MSIQLVKDCSFVRDIRVDVLHRGPDTNEAEHVAAIQWIVMLVQLCQYDDREGLGIRILYPEATVILRLHQSVKEFRPWLATCERRGGSYSETSRRNWS